MRVVTGNEPVHGKEPTDLVVRIDPPRRRESEAAIVVRVRGARLRRTMARAIAEALRAAAERCPAPALRVVRVRTRRHATLLGDRLAGAVAIVVVSERGRRHLPALVDTIRAAGALGVQLVWDGRDPERSKIERYLFDVLERARAMPSGPPVVLAKSTTVVETLRVLVGASRTRKEDRSS
jgi:hypothetical protein